MTWAGGLEFLKNAGCGLVATAVVIGIVAAVAYRHAPHRRLP